MAEPGFDPGRERLLCTQIRGGDCIRHDVIRAGQRMAPVNVLIVGQRTVARSGLLRRCDAAYVYRTWFGAEEVNWTDTLAKVPIHSLLPPHE